MSLNARFVSLKECVGFSILDSISILLKFIFLFNKMYSIQNLNDRKVPHTFGPRPLMFKLQQETLKSNDICVSWSSLKTDLFYSWQNIYTMISVSTYHDVTLAFSQLLKCFTKFARMFPWNPFFDFSFENIKRIRILYYVFW